MMFLLQQGDLNIKLDSISQGLSWLIPEIALMLTILCLILFDLIFKDKKSIGIASISFAGLGFTFFALVLQWPQEHNTSIISGFLQIGNSVTLLRAAFVTTLFISILIATQATKYKKDFFGSSELQVLLFGILLGANLLVMSNNLLMVYLSVELISICSYTSVALTKGRKKAEAGLKYLIYGGAASAIMLYGMSWLYGFTGTLVFDGYFIEALKTIDILPLSIAVLMFTLGLLFKLGAFPMHIWAPDVYEAAPIPVVNTISVLPKIAILAVFVNFSWTLFYSQVALNWTLWLSIIAMASMTVGNFSALWQKDIKRMLAYSSIAHAGFLLVGVIAFKESGERAMIFYGMIYLLMNGGAFYITQLVENKTGSTRFEAYTGKGPQLSWMGILIVIVMVSLTGLPPTAGFNAKLLIFSSVFEAYKVSQKSIYMLVLIFGLINTVIALFYYLKLPYFMYLKTNGSQAELTKHKPVELILGTLLIAPLLLLFFRPDWLVDLVNNISFAL